MYVRTRAADKNKIMQFHWKLFKNLQKNIQDMCVARGKNRIYNKVIQRQKHWKYGY